MKAITLYITGIKFQDVDAMHSSYYGLDQSGTECSKTLSIHNLRPTLTEAIVFPTSNSLLSWKCFPLLLKITSYNRYSSWQVVFRGSLDYYLLELWTSEKWTRWDKSFLSIIEKVSTLKNVLQWNLCSEKRTASTVHNVPELSFPIIFRPPRRGQPLYSGRRNG